MTREVRLAKNETFFREANELIEQDNLGWEEQEFVCECSRRGCLDRIVLTKPEYEHVRAESDRFFVLPGHENTEVEVVVEHFPKYLIVAKVGAARGIRRRNRPTRVAVKSPGRRSSLERLGRRSSPRRISASSRSSEHLLRPTPACAADSYASALVDVDATMAVTNGAALREACP